MSNKTSFMSALAITAALTIACVTSAMAAPIVGSINMAGDFQPVIGGVATQNLALADGIDFLPPVGGGTGAFSTLTATGDLSIFANMPGGGTRKDFTFNPFAAVVDFYTIAVGPSTLSFDLNNLAIDFQTNNFLLLSGTGLLHLTGFEDTPGTWTFSGQSSNGSASNATFAWSSGTTAAPVPEPGSLALVGLGLLAVSAIRRRKASATYA